MKRYILSAAARLDVLQIHNYLCEQSSIETADRIVRELRAAMRKPENARHGPHSQ